MDNKNFKEDQTILPAICCIGYNRPNSIRRLLDSVVNAIYDDYEIPLIISIDESPESNQVEAVAKEFDWKYGTKEIIRYPQRLGLKEHCLRCGDLSLKYGAVIFLEDDVLVAPGYYRYAKAAVNKYKNEENIFCISLYYDNWFSTFYIDFKPAYKGHDTFFAIFEESHGQCWTAKRWKEFREWMSENPNTEVYNKDVGLSVYQWNPNTSWSRFVCFYITEKKKFYVLPYHSYATNMSEAGTHAAMTTDICQTALSENIQDDFRFPNFEDAVIYDSHAERMDRFVQTIAGIDINKICLDLNGTKYDWEGYMYILTTQTLPYEIISQFGINMDPIENNIRYKVPGDAIRLYKIPANYSPPKDISSIPKYKISQRRLGHIYNKVPTRILLPVVIKKCLEAIKNRFQFIFK